MTVRRMIVFVLSLALVAAACGSDGEEGADGEQAETAAGDSDTGTDGDGADGSADDEAESTTTTEAVTGDSGSEWCQQIRTIADSDEPSPLDFDAFGKTPEQLREMFETNVGVMEEWGEVAPPEIEPDVDTVLGAFRTLLDLGNAAEWDLQAMATDPAFAEAFEDEGLEEAANRIDAYSSDVCGVDLASVGEPPAATPGGDATDPDADLASQILGALGIPPGFLSEADRLCMSEALEASGAFPDPIGPGYIPSAAALDALEAAATECGVVGLG